MTEHLPNDPRGSLIGKQILRSATSAGANYRSACRGRSAAEFVAKINICLEEADETGYWLELIEEGGLLPAGKLADLRKEADELCAILFTTLQTAKNGK